MSKVLLIVRDGWGISQEKEYNAVAVAETSNIDAYLAKFPHTELDASGEPVGLPKGYMGSSEVGHLNMGAGRIVVQELKRIKDEIDNGTLFKSPNLKKCFDNCLEKNSALHLMGLVQDEGVHAHQDHLFELMKHAKEVGIKKVYIHFFADGRDSAPRSALEYLKQLEDKIKEIGIGQTVTVQGRYYSMDRSKQWDLTDKAYNLIVKADGKKFKNVEDAIKDAYKNVKTPDGSDMVDEYIPPSVVENYDGVKDGDSVVFFNFRQDRAIQLVFAFVEDKYDGKRDKKLDITFCGLTKYYDEFPYNAIGAMTESGGMENLLGEVISNASLKQLRIAETQKFKHVTSFFNGKLLEPYKNETQIEVPSTFAPATFAQHPEMDAYIVAEETVKQLESEKFDFVLVNFANCDMVGHTGNFESVKQAVEIVDICCGRLVEVAKQHNYTIMITADHGNAEEMYDPKIKMTKTAHSTNPVEFIYIGENAENIQLRERGILSDIAPTILQELGVDIPAEMTAKSLIK